MEYVVFPYDDFFVRYLLGDESNTDLLLSFINAVHADYDFPQIVSVSIKNPFNLKTLAKEKESITDIKACDNTGRLYDIEIQVSGNESYKNRSLYYWARLYADQIRKGTKYKELKPTICINLINFTLLKNSNRIHTSYVIREYKNPKLILTDHLMIHFLELKKFEKHSHFVSSFDKWMGYFKYEGKEPKIMNTIIKDNPIFEKAHRKYEQFIQNDDLMEIYEARLKQELQHDMDIRFEREQGIKQGLEQGLEQGICWMHEAGISIPVIVQRSGLKKARVLEILKKHNLQV